jgi:hypothetical protein
LTGTETGADPDAGLTRWVKDQLAMFRENYPDRDFWYVPHYVKPDAWCSKLKEHATSDVVAYSPEQLLEEVANYDKNFGRGIGDRRTVKERRRQQDSAS